MDAASKMYLPHPTSIRLIRMSRISQKVFCPFPGHRTDSKISQERHHRFRRCSMFSRAATPLPVDEGRDSAQPKAEPGGVSRRPPETNVANAEATAVRAVSPGTYKRPPTERRNFAAWTERIL